MYDPQANQQQITAIMTLLSVDDKEEHKRYKQFTEEAKKEDNPSLKHNPAHHIRQFSSNCREVFPKLQSSRQELKRNLQKLESFEVLKREDMHYKVLQPIKLNQNINIEELQSKTTRVMKNKYKKENKVQKPKNDQSLLQLSKENEIRNLMKQKNYSANTLNLKTMQILQEIQQRGYRCSSILSRHHANDSKKHKKTNMVAFLKRVA